MFKKYLVFPSKLKDQFICDTKKIKTNFSLVFNLSEMIIIHLEVLVSMISKKAICSLCVAWYHLLFIF